MLELQSHVAESLDRGGYAAVSRAPAWPGVRTESQNEVPVQLRLCTNGPGEEEDRKLTCLNRGVAIVINQI